MAEFTFFVDAEPYLMSGVDLPASAQDLVDHGITSVDIPTEYGTDLGERIPVRVVGSGTGLRFYATLLRIDDEMQLGDLERVIAAAD